ncbi:hypothetical protein [Terrimonas alba]|uniref:hypothetical protein n=1 Tax=Terrimonas alba TaxID=3349636 RepID=UPI0035F2B3D7
MEDFNHLEGDEKLKAENEFLKMKLMLEQGTHFAGNDNTNLPTEIENQFLNNVMAFEKQFSGHKTIKVFDKIGRPQHFKPVAEIANEDIEAAWNQLSEYLDKHGIDLSVCSPNISVRELYRFTTEELFEHETDDMNLPGWTTNFIYDEFHPDPVYDNSRLVEQDLFNDIFRKADLFYDIHYAKDGFIFNGLFYNDFKLYGERINRFKSLFDEIEMTEFNVDDCTVKENNCYVLGQYKATARMGSDETFFAGSYEVKLVISELGYWDMKEIQISGFNS